MHEGALATALVRRVAAAQDQGAARVVAVRVRVGPLAGVSPEHLRDHVALAAQGTAVEGALLEVVAGEDLAAPGAQDVVLEDIKVEASPAQEEV